MQGERLLHRHLVLPYKVNPSRLNLKDSPFDAFLMLFSLMLFSAQHALTTTTRNFWMTIGRTSPVDSMLGLPIHWTQTDFGLCREPLSVMPQAGVWLVEFNATFGLEQDAGVILLTPFEVVARVGRDGARSGGRKLLVQEA